MQNYVRIYEDNERQSRTNIFVLVSALVKRIHFDYDLFVHVYFKHFENQLYSSVTFTHENS